MVWSRRSGLVPSRRLYNAGSTKHPYETYGLLDARIVWDLSNNKTSVAIWGTNLNGKKYFRGALDLASGELINGDTTDKYGRPINADLGYTIIYPLSQTFWDHLDP